MYNGLSQVYCINQKEEPISKQRVNNRVEILGDIIIPFIHYLYHFKFDTIDMNIIFADNMDSNMK